MFLGVAFRIWVDTPNPFLSEHGRIGFVVIGTALCRRLSQVRGAGTRCWGEVCGGITNRSFIVIGIIVRRRGGFCHPLNRSRGLFVDMTFVSLNRKIVNYHSPFLDGRTSCASQGVPWMRNPFRNRTPRNRTSRAADRVRQGRPDFRYPEGARELAPPLPWEPGLNKLCSTVPLRHCCSGIEAQFC